MATHVIFDIITINKKQFWRPLAMVSHSMGKDPMSALNAYYKSLKIKPKLGTYIVVPTEHVRFQDLPSKQLTNIRGTIVRKK